MAFEQQTDAALQRALDFAHRHRQSLVTAVLLGLTGFTLTAVAIAPLAPDASLLPQRVVAESVAPPDDLQTQLQALAAQEFALTRNDLTRRTDSPTSLLARLGVADSSAVAFLRQDATARLLLAGRAGKMVQAQTSDDGRLISLVARYPAERAEQAQTHFTRMTIERVDGRWLARLDSVPLGSRLRLASGAIRNTLFAATDEAGIPEAVASQIAEIFSTDIDFHRELRKGDTFSIVYESQTADGEPVPWSDGAGRIVAAEFVNAGRPSHAVWFTQPDGRGAYFGLDGQSRKRSFLASPMEFSRVTSGFAERLHPILRDWRQHLGVDYSAPMGTPVRSVGDGVVDFAGWRNGYGNVVQVQHGKDRSTLYAHLSSIDVKLGQRVEQGARVGAVGMTGWSTGPHLHFEFRVAGQHHDPLAIAKAAETINVDARARPQFQELVRNVQVKLDLAETLIGQRVSVD